MSLQTRRPLCKTSGRPRGSTPGGLPPIQELSKPKALAEMGELDDIIEEVGKVSFGDVMAKRVHYLARFCKLGVAIAKGVCVSCEVAPDSVSFERYMQLRSEADAMKAWLAASAPDIGVLASGWDFDLQGSSARCHQFACDLMHTLLSAWDRVYQAMAADLRKAAPTPSLVTSPTALVDKDSRQVLAQQTERLQSSGLLSASAEAPPM